MIEYEVTFKSSKSEYMFSFETKKEAILSIQYADDCEILKFEKIDYDYIKGKEKRKTIYNTKSPYNILNVINN